MPFAAPMRILFDTPALILMLFYLDADVDVRAARQRTRRTARDAEVYAQLREA